MPFLSTDKFGAGPLYNFASTDPNAYLTGGTTYFQTNTSSWAIQQDVFDSTFVCAGEIGSNGVGVRVSTNDGSRIDVTASGYISTFGEAIDIFATGAFFLTNAGTIVSVQNAIVVEDVPGARLLLRNTGTIQAAGNTAIDCSDGVDSIYNTGTIVGAVSLGGGSDRFDTSKGVFAGIVSGGTGDDSYTIAGNERILEYTGGGNDLVSSFGNYALADGIERLTLVGSADMGWGNDLDNIILASDFDCSLYGRDGIDTIYGGGGDDTLNGGRGNDRLYGAAGDNRLYGGAGNDQLSAELGDNRFDGGAGDDVIFSVSGGDAIIGGAGHDLANFSSSETGLTVDMGAGTIATGDGRTGTISGTEDVIGSFTTDTITGSSAANLLNGRTGNDVLRGAGGDDILIGGTGADALDGGTGEDTASYVGAVTGGVNVDLAAGVATGGDATGDTFVAIENLTGTGYADSLTGSTAANVIRGGGGDDTLRGGGGNDTLYGESGSDTLNGNGGADVFGYADIVAGTAGGWGSDSIVAFQNGVDKISFAGASAIHSMADLTISTASGDTLIDTGGGEVIRLVGFARANLDASDFIFDAAAARLESAAHFAAPAAPLADLGMIV